MIKDFIKGQNILFTGIGGGYDIFSALPIFFDLKDRNCTFANFTFSNFDKLDKEYFEKDGNIVKCLQQNPEKYCYFPEGWIKHFLKEKNIDIDVYALKRTGVVPLRNAYQKLIKEKNIDTIILVDGGIDSIMTGNEQNPGTILEDFISLVALKDFPLKKYIVCNGFGTEIEEKLDFNSALKYFNNNVLDCEFLNSNDEKFKFYQEIYEQSAEKCVKGSHIHGKIIQASKGEINNPFMQIWWLFDYDKIIEKNIFKDIFDQTQTFQETMNLYFKNKHNIFNFKRM